MSGTTATVTVVVSVTDAGAALAARLPYEHRHGRLGDTVRELWDHVDRLVVVGATGIAVRVIAPLLADKRHDPAVVCLDDGGRWAVALAGGHHGANALAREVAALVGAEPVVTTASESAGLPALDDLPGFRTTGDVAAVTRAWLDGTPPSLDHADLPHWPLPTPLAALADPAFAASPSASRPRPTDASPAAVPADLDRSTAPDPDGPASRPLGVRRSPDTALSTGTDATATGRPAHLRAPETPPVSESSSESDPGGAAGVDGPRSSGPAEPMNPPQPVPAMDRPAEAPAGDGGLQPHNPVVGDGWLSTTNPDGATGRPPTGGADADAGLSDPGDLGQAALHPPATSPATAVTEQAAPPIDEEAATGRSGGSSGRPGAAVRVTDRMVEPGAGGVVLRPASLVVGVGSSSGADPAGIAELVAGALAAAGLARDAVGLVASVDLKRGEPGIVALAGELGVELRTFPAEALAAVAVPTPSAVVEAAVGTPSVAEAAALLAAGPDAELVVTKQRSPEATVAVARRARPEGHLAVVGLGPGDPAWRTPAAAAAVRGADVVIGYGLYVDLAADLLAPHHEVVRSPIGAETDRCREALERAAAGQRVALVCSGDPGVFAMASLVCELAPALGNPPLAVVPGVTAAYGAAAVLGAPLGHDHAMVSLSDLLTPWPLIERRLVAVAEGDLAVSFYNPRSQRRTWQLGRALKILAAHRPADCPVAVVSDVSRAGRQRIVRTTLARFDPTVVDMLSLVVVGSSTTRWQGDHMITPRGYPPVPGPEPAPAGGETTAPADEQVLTDDAPHAPSNDSATARPGDHVATARSTTLDTAVPTP